MSCRCHRPCFKLSWQINSKGLVRFQVIKAVTAKIVVFCDVTMWSPIVCKTTRCYVSQNNVIFRHLAVVTCCSKCFEKKQETAYCLLSTVCCLPSTACCLLSTAYCVLSTVYFLLSTVCCVLCTVYCLLSSVYWLLSTACCLLCTVHCLLPAVSCLLATVYRLLPAVCCLLSTVYRLLSAVYRLLSAACCLLSAVYCLLSTVPVAWRGRQTAGTFSIFYYSNTIAEFLALKCFPFL